VSENPANPTGRRLDPEVEVEGREVEDGGYEYFETFDGVKIAFVDLGDGPPVLLHHGFASDSYTNWVRPGVARALTTAGRRVVLVDARGHGRSGKPHDPAAYADGAMIKDARALLDHLGFHGIGKVDLVGYSMGAFVASGLALCDERAASIVLAAAGTAQVGIQDSRRSDQNAEALESADRSTVTDATALAFRNFAEATGGDLQALAAVQRSGMGLGSAEALASIDVPTLVLTGADDTLVGGVRTLAEVIPGARLVTVPGDHLSAVTRPEFAAAIVGFLEERATA
jgi:pimeloyl-ACP methyl ester carboxylesterase